MKIFLLGATGATGRELLKSLSVKFEIKVLVRNPEIFLVEEFKSPLRIEIIKGDVSEADKLRQHFEGCDVIISSLGTGTENRLTDIYSNGGRNILNAMRVNGIKKLITISSGLIDVSDPSTDNFFLNRIIRPNYNKPYYDMIRWETILDDTKDIDWVCVRPTKLINKPATHNYRVQLNHCPPNGWKISRADIADFILNQITSDEYIHKKPVLAY
jgi:putative NADH-flavin reductase